METILIDKSTALKDYKGVNPKSHKGLQGHALIIGGSYGKMGAVCLSSKAALKSGCGLVTAYVPKIGYSILQITIPEAMVLTDKKKIYITEIAFNFKPDAIGIGPGIGQNIKTQKALKTFLTNNETPLVIDADALNILAQNQEWLSLLRPKTILTPHQKELERLIGKWISEEDKIQKVIDFSLMFKIIVVVKGSPTLVVDGNTIYENSTGNAALATAGSGDVLTGIISSFLAQCYAPCSAAILGVYVHGLTADIALHETGYQSFIASDIISYLGKAFLTLE